MNPDAKRRIIIYTAVTITIILLLAVIRAIIYFTLLPPKQPKVVATPVGIRHFELGYLPVIALELTLGLDIFIKNGNYAAYEYTNTTTSIYYRGGFVGSAPNTSGKIEARATQNITMTVELLVDKMAANPNFVPDVFGGMLNLMSKSSIEGHAVVLKGFKLHASTFVECNIAVYLKSRNSSSSCNIAKLKI